MVLYIKAFRQTLDNDGTIFRWKQIHLHLKTSGQFNFFIFNIIYNVTKTQLTHLSETNLPLRSQ